MPGSGELARAAAEARVRQAVAAGAEPLAGNAPTGSTEAGPQLARSATPPAAAAGAVAVSRHGRPALRLVAAHEPQSSTATLARSEAPRQLQQAAAGAGSRRTPTSGARLAAATGATISQGEEGYETVVFPRPAGMAFAPAVSLMRAADPAPATGAQPAASDATAAPQGAPAPAPPPAQSGGGGGGGGDIEEIYTQVIERLRRDLLADRERMGDLLGDLP